MAHRCKRARRRSGAYDREWTVHCELVAYGLGIMAPRALRRSSIPSSTASAPAAIHSTSHRDSSWGAVVAIAGPAARISSLRRRHWRSLLAWCGTATGAGPPALPLCGERGRALSLYGGDHRHGRLGGERWRGTQPPPARAGRERGEGRKMKSCIGSESRRKPIQSAACKPA